MTDSTTAASSDNGSAGSTAGAIASTIPNSAVDPASASTGTTSAGANAPAAGGVDWLKDADELTVGYVQNKGWKDPSEVLNSYQNLEKLFGADKAGNTVVLPKEGATPEELSAFYNKIGRPADADGYKIQVPDGIGDPEFAKAAAGKFHELGLSQKQGEALAEWWNGNVQNQVSAQQAQTEQTFQADETALRTDWGAAYDQNKVAAQNAVAALGLDGGTIDKLQASLGHKGTMQLLAKIGAKSGEGSFVTGENNGSFGNVPTPAQAKADIKALMDDKTFTAKYLSKDSDAVAKMALLHKYAFPEN